jgi:hypothetical protein
VTAGGERYAVKHHDFILFMPTTDETTLEPLPEEERPRTLLLRVRETGSAGFFRIQLQQSI